MKFRLSFHAAERLYERRIDRDAVASVISNHEVIEEYPNDLPFPSRLVLGWVDGRPLHLVLAYDSQTGVELIVTAYEPGTDVWQTGFKIRRKP